MKENPIAIKEITSADDSRIAAIVRYNFELYDLAVPGTVYFDPELDHLSNFYNAKPDKRKYYILFDENGQVSGGCGFAEFDYFDDCAELQKLYLSEHVKGFGYSKQMVKLVQEEAKKHGYKKLYIETNHKFDVACKLYESMGFKPIERPSSVQHEAMDIFLMKEL